MCISLLTNKINVNKMIQLFSEIKLQMTDYIYKNFWRKSTNL